MGRKIWKAPDPVALARALAAVIRDRENVDYALQILSGLAAVR